MEIEELKACWDKLSIEVERQNILNTKIIEQMTHQTFRRKLNSIVYPELTGSIACLITAIALIWNFNVFDTPLYQVLCSFSVLFLVALSVLSIQSVNGLKNEKIDTKSYLDTVTGFFLKKIRFQKIQKINVWIGCAFMLVFFPVAIKLTSGKDMFQNKSFVVIALPLVAIVQLLASKWVLDHYNKILKKTEAVLAEVSA